MAERLFLKKLRETAELTQQKVADICGVSRAAVTQWESGATEPSRESLYKMAQIFGMTEGELYECYKKPYSYEMEPERHRVMERGKEMQLLPTAKKLENYYFVPVHSAQAECGNGYQNFEDQQDSELAFRRSWLKSVDVKPEALRVIYACGDSMNPVIIDGDVLLVDTSRVEPRSGRIYALRRPDGAISAKRLIQKMTGAWIISSDNPDDRKYPDEDCDDSTLFNVPIIGEVVWRGGSGF